MRLQQCLADGRFTSLCKWKYAGLENHQSPHLESNSGIVNWRLPVPGSQIGINHCYISVLMNGEGALPVTTPESESRQSLVLSSDLQCMYILPIQVTLLSLAGNTLGENLCEFRSSLGVGEITCMYAECEISNVENFFMVFTFAFAIYQWKRRRRLQVQELEGRPT
jgi:hypothetical protein